MLRLARLAFSLTVAETPDRLGRDKFVYTALNVILRAKDHKLDKLKVLFNGYREGLSFNPKRNFVTE